MSDQDTNMSSQVSEDGLNPDAVQQASKAAEDDSDTQKLIAEMAAKMVEEKLAPIKEKLDKAYKERDELATRASKAEEAAKAAEIKRLEEDGKDLEAANMRLSALQGKLEALQAENTSLTRDRIVADATMRLDFRNDSAKNMAIKEITEQLVQTEDGTWKHRSGIPIKDFVEHYSKDDDKTFLFKPKNSSGSSTMTAGQATNTTARPEFLKTPMSSWTTEQMMTAVREGWLDEGKSLQEQMATQYI